MSVRSSVSPTGQLKLPAARWVRAIFCLQMACGLIIGLAGVALAANSRWPIAVLFIILALTLEAVGMLGFRMRVVVDESGVTCFGFRKTFVPAADISSVTVKPVLGAGSAQRAQAAIVRRDGSVVPLDTTLVVRSGPDHAQLLAVTSRIEQALGRFPGRS